MRAIKNHIANSLFIIAIMASGCVSAQSVQKGTYEDINRMVGGRDVVVVLLDSTRYKAEGIAIGIDSTSWMSKSVDGPQKHVVPTSKINKLIEYRRGEGASSGMVAGALGGAAIGFMVGAAGASELGGEWAGLAGMAFAAVGGLIGIPFGAILGAGVESERTYEIHMLELLRPGNRVRIITNGNKVYVGEVLFFRSGTIYLDIDGKAHAVPSRTIKLITEDY